VAERDLVVFPDLVGSCAARERGAQQRRGPAAQQVAAREIDRDH
jgi:hypothetical protein